MMWLSPGCALQCYYNAVPFGDDFLLDTGELLLQNRHFRHTHLAQVIWWPVAWNQLETAECSWYYWTYLASENNSMSQYCPDQLRVFFRINRNTNSQNLTRWNWVMWIGCWRHSVKDIKLWKDTFKLFYGLSKILNWTLAHYNLYLVSPRSLEKPWPVKKPFTVQWILNIYKRAADSIKPAEIEDCLSKGMRQTKWPICCERIAGARQPDPYLFWPALCWGVGCGVRNSRNQHIQNLLQI